MCRPGWQETGHPGIQNAREFSALGKLEGVQNFSILGPQVLLVCTGPGDSEPTFRLQNSGKGGLTQQRPSLENENRKTPLWFPQGQG